MEHIIFYDMLKKHVREKKTTIESVVKEAGLSISSYNSYRSNGKFPRADVVVKIAKILETSAEMLVTGKTSNLTDVASEERKAICHNLDELVETIKQYKEKLKLYD